MDTDDESSASSVSAVQSQHIKKSRVSINTKNVQRARRSSSYIPEDESPASTEGSPRAQRKTRVIHRAEKEPNHWDFFPKPEGWYIKNPRPNVVEIGNLQGLDIRQQQYPLEVVSQIQAPARFMLTFCR